MQRLWIGSTSMPEAGETVLDLGQDHPTRPGAVRIEIDASEGVIQQARVTTGWSHRGVEKLFEVRDFRAALALADRHEWQSPFSGELAFVTLVEEALGIQVSERTAWLRMIAAEHSRLHGLMAALTWLDPERLQQPIAVVRERLRRQMAAWTGNRLHPMAVRIGGVVEDITDDWWASEADVAADALGAIADAREALAARTDLRGIGTLDASQIASLGLSGSTARASGVEVDVRRDAPYLLYPQLTRRLTGSATEGDAHARFQVMIDDARATASTLLDCLGRVDEVDGPISTHLPKVLRMPEGEWYTAVEGWLGEAGVRVVSRGHKTPWRVFLRTASLPQVMALETAVEGQPVDAVEAIVASLPWVIGDVDR